MYFAGRSGAATYALAGCIAGGAIALPLHRYLFQNMITAYWGNPWTVPTASLVVILLIVASAAAAAVYPPAKRIRNTAITDTINELRWESFCS